MSNQEINNYIDTLHFKSFKKVVDKVKEQFPHLTNADIRRIIKKRIHDKKLNNKRIYQVKIFSPFTNAWFTDIYDNLEGNEPRYWEIFINTNTRYVEAYPLNNKTKNSINEVLRLFVNKYHPRKLTSDEESGLIANDNLTYLKENKCGLYIIQEKNHSALAIIDRFIRTLRDMNTPGDGVNEGTNVDSTNSKYKHIDKPTMEKLLTKYNNSIHSSTGYKPIDMMNNKDLELKYIKKCIDEKQRQQEIADFKLKEGSLVRYYLDRTPKRRTNISRETYKIESRAGNIYTIIALDGTTKDLPRWKLIHVDPNEKHVMGQTLGTDKGIVEKIINEVSNNRVNVKWLMPDGSEYTQVINNRELRFPTPQFESKLECEFKTRRGH